MDTVVWKKNGFNDLGVDIKIAFIYVYVLI